MKNVNIKLAIIIFINLSITAIAAPIFSEDCSVIKNEKKRLTCYDALRKQPTTESNDVTAAREVKNILAQPNIKTAEQADRVILVEAGLVYKSGDIKPVARSEFYLLDEDLVEILKNASVQLPIGVDETSPEFSDLLYRKIIVNIFGKVHSSIDIIKGESNDARRLRDFHAKAIAAIEPHIIQQATTGFSGKAKFDSLKNGTYYLMGVYKTARGMAVWNSRVDTKSSETTVILDQNNAASVD